MSRNYATSPFSLQAFFLPLAQQGLHFTPSLLPYLACPPDGLGPHVIECNMNGREFGVGGDYVTSIKI